MGRAAEPAHEVDVPAFFIDAAPVTNARYAEFIADGGRAWVPKHALHPLDALTLIAQAGENFLTGDTEFFSQLVHAGLTCHYISISRGDSGG